MSNTNGIYIFALDADVTCYTINSYETNERKTLRLMV